MKKHLFTILLCGLLTVPFASTMADTVSDGQSTEGKDFWVTFLQADQKTSKNGELGNYNKLILSLSISSREDCDVDIVNPFTGYTESVHVNANEIKIVDLYEGHPVCAEARSAMATSGIVCYAVNSEKVDTCALHVTSTANIALFAANYKKATFDATNVLPTPSLLNEYVIQSYTPSDHDGNGQGTHFAVIATEDNTVVDYCPTVNTAAIAAAKSVYEFSQGDGMSPEELALANFKPGDTLHSPVLMKGQVYYVWTGEGEGDNYDLSGTYVKSDKPIAVFQGSPHTNIPFEVDQRDHIVSQAMPVQYWGNTFVLTASASRPSDIIRIMALNDETEVRINGELVHTFDFNSNPKHFWEFEIGTNGAYAKDGSCLVTTSCPCAVHLFIVSQKYHSDNKGDPAMLWINPIEQQIDQVTFATYSSHNGTSSHYVNVVTDKPELMTLDDNSIQSDFKPVNGSDTYHYAQISLGSQAASHTLKSDGSNFIAHVYGFTNNESYGYSAGGATKPLTQSIYINGEEFSPDKENQLCGVDTVHFACKPDYEFEKIVWHFGDGSADVETTKSEDVPHFYQNGGDYDATCSIYRNSSNLCAGQSAVDVIKIKVTIGRYQFTIGDPDIPCPEDGKQYIGRIPYTSTISLTGNNVEIDFDKAAKDAGFNKDNLKVEPGHFVINIPSTAEASVPYGISVKITSNCGNKDTTMLFQLPIGNDVIAQRYNNVLGLIKDPRFDGLTLSDFQWYRTSDSTALQGQVSATLNMYEVPNENFKNDAFYVCYTINKGLADERRTCACAKAFVDDPAQHEFNPDLQTLSITATYGYKHGDKVFVNADYNGQTDIECYAQWIDASGHVYKDLKFNIPDGGCTIETPSEAGLYLLRVSTDGKNRSFKFIIQ
ncbi:MAG: T9SS type A sorting domain-containing protein [Paludibacteraceae bacterium]|nr:T9SS type A sorting domain-containing protein [Paludibacteraceae bacterium]